MVTGSCYLQYQIWVDIRCPQQGSWLPFMIGRCQGHPSNPYSFDQYVSYIYLSGSAIHTHSKTCTTANTTSTDTMITSTNDKANTPPILSADWKDTLSLMQRIDPFCKCISKRLLSAKEPSHEVNTFTHIKGFINKHVIDSNQRFLAHVILKFWQFIILIKVHDNLGHKGVNKTYHVNITGRVWARTSHKYINNCAFCKRGKAKTQGYLLQMTDIPDRPFDKIAIDLVSDLNISASGN